MEKMTDPMISENGSVYSLAGLRRLLKELDPEVRSAKEKKLDEGERLCG